MQGEGTKKRISWFMGMLLTMTALGFDLIDFLLECTGLGFLVQWIFDIAGWMVFNIWYFLLGVNVLQLDKFVSVCAVLIAKFIPGVGALPEWTGWVTVTTASVMAEDELSAFTGLSTQQISGITSVAEGVAGGLSGDAAEKPQETPKPEEPTPEEPKPETGTNTDTNSTEDSQQTNGEVESAAAASGSAESFNAAGQQVYPAAEQ